MRERTPSRLRRLRARLAGDLAPLAAYRARRRSLSGRVLPDDHVSLPNWHDLVRPGPLADPPLRGERLERRWLERGRPRYVLAHDDSVVPRWVRRKQHGRGWNGGFATSQRARPARPSGVALASPTSNRGFDQRMFGR